MAKLDGKQIKEKSIPNSALINPITGATSASDKDKTPIATSGDNADSSLTISNSPTGGNVDVVVNGLGQNLGDGVKTKDCFFSEDNGATAKTYNAIKANDKLYWNGSIAGFDLAATDSVDFYYSV